MNGLVKQKNQQLYYWGERGNRKEHFRELKGIPYINLTAMGVVTLYSFKLLKSTN